MKWSSTCPEIAKLISRIHTVPFDFDCRGNGVLAESLPSMSSTVGGYSSAYLIENSYALMEEMLKIPTEVDSIEVPPSLGMLVECRDQFPFEVRVNEFLPSDKIVLFDKNGDFVNFASVVYE